MIDLYPQKSSTFLKSVRSADRQSIAVTDLISEGPVYGLVDGQASVYLNDDRVAPLSSAPVRASTGPMSVTLTNGSTTATITGNVVDNPLLAAEYGDKYLIVRGGNGTTTVTAAVTTNGVADGNNSTPITTSSSFFTNAMRTAPSEKGSLEDFVPARLVPKAGNGTTVDGEEEEGIISTVASGTSATFVAGEDGPGGVWLPDEDSYDIVLDKIVKIASISGTTITLSSNWDAATGSYKFDVSGATVQTAVDEIDQTKISKYKGVTTQFRVGTLSQTAFSGEGGIGSTSISNSPSAGGAIEWTTGFGGSQAPKELVGSSNSGFNLTASQLKEVDEARVTFAYGAHYAVSGKGNDKTTYTRYKIQLALKAVGAADFDTPITIDDNKIHAGMYKNSVTWVENIDLTRYRPFADFKIIISRKTNHEGPAYKTPTETYHDWTQVTSASISQTTCVIKEILTHPYSAMAKVTFGTDQFQSMPARTYHTRGMKVLVPSNYITREETGGAATYNRNTSTGAIEATYQDWDGAFRTSKVYTNNPAWVFNDILLNNRYGLGDFLKDADIDKFSLYRIARYCDELVPDGKGGQEPRFTANLYLTKQADAFKVLKDMATTFRSMIYYLDGQVVPVIDAPKGPVYNFTKANVIDGSFSYEGTGSKTRINQVIVSWMNPDANYALEPLIVEDRVDIARSNGVIISQNAVAFGATSEGQATRYGRWKLWTAANQKEVVTFSSALNTSFLVPGDIVNIQDSDRYAVRYGGRISNTGVNRTTMGFPLDSSVTLNSGSTYTVSVIFVKPVAFAMEDIYTTAATPVLVYSKGDIVEQGFIDHDNNGSFTLQDIDSEDDSLNAKLTATAASPMSLNWANYTRVETRNVSTTVGNTVNDLSVSAAFTEVPDAEAIWVLTETKDGLEVSSSSKEYKIIALSENSKNITDITAVEHYNEKFDAVDVDFTTFVADTVFPPLVANDEVPPPIDAYAISGMDDTSVGEELTIHWTPPAAVGTASDVYEFIKGYEISHNFALIDSPKTILNKDTNTWQIKGLVDGSYKVAVRTINTLDNLSNPTVFDVTVLDRFRENIPRMPEGVPYTGTTSVGFGISSDNFVFKKFDYRAKSPNTYSTLITNTNSVATAWQQSCANLPTITWSENDRNSEGQFILEHAYILLDASDSTDRLKLLKYHKPSSGINGSFWYNVGTGNTTNKFGNTLTGTFSKLANSSRVTGSGTAFSSEIQAGDILKLGTEEIRVAAVSNNTTLYLTSSTVTAHSGVTGSIQNFRIDYVNDVIIARVYNTSSGLVLAETYSKVDANIKAVTDIADSITAAQMNVSDLGDIATSMTGVTLTNPTITGGSISGFAPLASPALTGTPTAPTASDGTNTTQLATTQFVSTAVSNLVDSAPSDLNTLNELAAALADDDAFSTTVNTALGNRLRVDTASQGLSSTQKTNGLTNLGIQNINNTSDANKPVSTAQQTALNLKANIASPTFTGTVGGISKSMVGLGNVANESKATMFSSAALTGTPTAPTAGSGTNTTQIATTAFVQAAASSAAGGASGTTYTVSIPSSTTKLRLSGSDSTTDDIEFVGSGATTVTRTNDGKFTISSTDTNTNTNTQNQYAISCVDGDNSDEEKIRLSGSGHNGNTTDDVVLEAGTGLTISRSGDKITFTNSNPTDSGGTVTSVSGTAPVVSSGGNTPAISVTTATVANGGTSLATGDQIYDHVTSRISGFVTSSGVTSLSSTTTNQLTVTDGSTATPELNIVTGAVADSGTALATGDQIHTFVTGQGFVTSSGVTSVSGTAPIAVTSGATPTVSISTATTSAAGSMSSSDKSKLDNIESNATADQTASEILTLLKTVDTNTSGLNAATLDGQEGTYYLNYDNFSNTPTTITTAQANAITANTAKVGITTSQANAITANTAKVGLSTNNVTNASVSGSTLTLTRQGASSVTFTDNNDNTTYDLSVAQNTDNTNNNPRLLLAGTNSTNDHITMIGGGAITTTRDSDTQFTISHTDTNSTTSPAGFSNADSLATSGKVKLLAGISHDTYGHITGSNGLQLDFTGPVVETSSGVVDIVASTITATNINSRFANFGSMAADVASITNLTTDFLDADQIISKDIRVGASDEVTVANFVVGRTYKVVNTGSLSQAQWNTIGGTTEKIYGPGKIFIAANVSFPTDANAKADDFNSIALINGTTLTGQGAHLNSEGDFFVGVHDGARIFFDQSAGTITIKGTLDASDIVSGTLNANSINNISLTAGANGSFSLDSGNTPGQQTLLLGNGARGDNFGNIAIGFNAAAASTSSNSSEARENVCVGVQAGRSMTTGFENIFIGAYAGSAITGGVANKTGQNNIGIGATGLNASPTLRDLTSGSKNIAFGEGAGRNITTGSGNVIIGGYAGNTTDENTITLATGAGSRRLYFDTSGNATFTANVEIEGTSGLTTPKTTVTDGTRLLELQTFSGYSQINSMASSSGSAQELRFTQGLSGTQLAIRYNQIQAHESLLLDGATTTAASTANIISATSNDGNGTTQYHIVFTKSDASTALGRITTNNFGTTYTTSSDYRLKENVQAVAGATNKVLSLNPVNFQWKDSTVTQDGFLAHEVAEVVPEAVVGEKDGAEMQSIDQSKLVPLLVKTIQELEARITALENP